VPTPAPPGTIVTESVEIGGEEIDVTIEDGNATLYIDDDVLAEIIENAEYSIAVDLSDFYVVSVTIPADVWESIAETELELELVMPYGTLTFCAYAMYSILEQAEGADITATIYAVELDELTPAQQNVIRGDDIVLRITLYADDAYITDIDGYLSIAVAYYGELPVNVWRVTPEGTLELLNSWFNPEDNTVTFVTRRLSVFIIGVEPETAVAIGAGFVAPIAVNLVGASGWATAYISRAFDMGVVPVALQSNYTSSITRAEFASLVVALYESVMGQSVSVSPEIYFIDTTDQNVLKAAHLGVVQGLGDGRFAPDNLLTRQEAAVMLARLANTLGMHIQPTPVTFADNYVIADWAAQAVGQMQSANIMSGVGGNMFEPLGRYTREQSIVTIVRLFDFM
jgi:hypothetical protein